MCTPQREQASILTIGGRGGGLVRREFKARLIICRTNHKPIKIIMMRSN